MTASHTTTDDARIPDHCGWAARGYWREAYDDAVAALRQVTAERDEWQAACSTISASLGIKVTDAEARAEAAEAEVARLRDAMTVLSDQWTHGHLWAGESRADVIRGVERIARIALNGGKTDE